MVSLIVVFESAGYRGVIAMHWGRSRQSVAEIAIYLIAKVAYDMCKTF